MEQLKYVIEDSTIAELLGVQNFTNKESAILELVKNAFDAKATELEIIIEKDKIIVKDNGEGMDADDIRKHWMHIGKSEKGYSVRDLHNVERVLAGSKGIGRFALARIGSLVELTSKKRNSSDKAVLWTTDWNKSLLKEKDLGFVGTEIKIEGLRDKWNKSSVEKLNRYLSRTYNDSLMKIIVIFEDKSREIVKYFVEPKLGRNCTSIINLYYSSTDYKLKCTVTSDEFLPEASELCKGIDIGFSEIVVDMLSELEGNKEISIADEEMEEVLAQLGDFTAELYFSLKESSGIDNEKFLYKERVASDRYESGVILYRNSFSISSYDGTKDWIGLGKRSRKSPAAATHPTGSWRVRENQLSGKVVIDKKRNHFLEDLSNRQGLNENVYYEVFLKILETGISSFERYRQSIIKKINVKNKIEGESNKAIIDRVIRNPKVIKDLRQDEVTKFISEIKEFRKENVEFKKEILTTEERYKYDVRILNVLATSGLKATSIAHEMHNDRNTVADVCDAIISAMEEFGVWDIVNEEEKTKYAYSNIPRLIKKNQYVNSKVIAFMDTMLDEVKKSQFASKERDVKRLLDDLKSGWERDYAWIEILIELNEDIFYLLSGDTLRVIFDNLILNSIQQNDNRSNLLISIKGRVDGEVLEFVYQDNGKGLAKKYIANPLRILEVHETSRENGHGLGMWIVNNTIIMSGGQIKEINGADGFMICFTIGGKN